MEAAFSIYKTRNIVILQQSLTFPADCLHRQIVTPDTDRRTVGYSEFPAYSQIYRQQGRLLSHDVLNPARVPL